MKKMLAASLCLLSAVANAGQFGLERGESVEAIRAKVKLTETRPYLFEAGALPNGHPAFDDYRLLITPPHGLCKIMAFTPAISSDAYGESVQSKFSNLYGALQSKYGSNRKFDFLRVGSIWREPRDWMMGLKNKERTLAAYWDREEKSELPDDLVGIVLEVFGIDSRTAMISLTYSFSNADECAEWARNQENSSL